MVMEKTGSQSFFILDHLLVRDFLRAPSCIHATTTALEDRIEGSSIIREKK